MNRNIFLILSAVTVIVLLAIWIYLLFFASQSNDAQNPIQESGEFNDFDLGTDTFNEDFNDVEAPEVTEPDTAGNPNGYDPDILRQLTTKHGAGYEEVQVASTTYVYFMESGVGHIYAINLDTGVEERISATTIPNTREAAFTTNGEYVAVKVGDSTGPNDLLIGEIDPVETSVNTSELASSVTEFTFTEDNTLLYGALANASVIVNEYNIESEISNRVFSTPFREATVLLSNAAAGPHYFFPKTSAVLESFVYKVSNGSIERLPLDGFGLTANGGEDEVMVSKRIIAEFVTDMYNLETGETTRLQDTFLPSKCLFSTTTYCAADGSTYGYLTTDQWFRGENNFADSLWSVVDGEPQLLINITAFSGRNVDVIDNQMGSFNDDWYFKNKVDNTLWVFETSRLQVDNN